MRIEPPSYLRHDPINGTRYGSLVEVVFADVPMTPGRKPSPDAGPGGSDASYAGC